MNKTSESSADSDASDAYTENLAKVNDSNAVLASEDIVNAQGVLIAKKGTSIDQRTAAKLMTFRLTKSLETSVTIENEIDATTLLFHIRNFLKENEPLRIIHERINLESSLPSLTRCINDFPVIKQKMTVMSILMPALYQQSLFSAWLASVIGKRMGLPESHINALFVSGLTHDIGMLHITSELLNKKTELTPEEWRQIQAHPVIGQKILASTDKLPKEVSRAVLEHHERVDGSGYPTGKAGPELHLFGQIIAMTDIVQAAYRQNSPSGESGIRNLFPVLQMNKEAHFYKTYEALITTLKQVGFAETTSITDLTLSESCKFVRERHAVLSNELARLNRIAKLIPGDNDEKELRAIDVSLLQCMKTVSGAGILDEGYLRWLDQLETNKLNFAYRELEDVVLMMKELQFQISRIKKIAHTYTEYGKNRALGKAIRTILEETHGH